MISDDGFIHLGPDERVEDRPFTTAEHSARDLGHLRRLLERTRFHLDGPEWLPAGRKPIVIRDDETFGHFHRTVISLPERLRSGERLTAVGFFGIRQPNDVEAEVDAVDDALVEEIPGKPYVVSYCSMALGDGNQGNLILMTCRPSAKVGHIWVWN